MLRISEVVFMQKIIDALIKEKSKCDQSNVSFYAVDSLDIGDCNISISGVGDLSLQAQY